MASAVVSDNFETSGGGVPQLGGTSKTTCKAWVNFDYSSGSIHSSFNVSSITDFSNSRCDINFTTAMTDANYCIVHSVGDSAGGVDKILTVRHNETNHVNGFRTTLRASSVDTNAAEVGIAIFSN